MTALTERIIDARRRLPFPNLLGLLDLGDAARKSARCPLHEDQSPSFSVFEGAHGWRWKCHAGCGEGDEIDFLMVYLRIGRAHAVHPYVEMAGANAAPLSRPASTPKLQGIVLPQDVTPGREADWRELALLRNISWHSVGIAAHNLGTLFFGTVCGFKCWILTDERRLCAEARRMDGKPFPAVGKLPCAKLIQSKGA